VSDVVGTVFSPSAGDYLPYGENEGVPSTEDMGNCVSGAATATEGGGDTGGDKGQSVGAAQTTDTMPNETESYFSSEDSDLLEHLLGMTMNETLHEMRRAQTGDIGSGELFSRERESVSGDSPGQETGEKATTAAEFYEVFICCVVPV
jgi:hypothetical protein